MSIRLSKALSELNIGLQTAVEFLENKKELGEVKAEPSFKLSDAQYAALQGAFQQDKEVRSLIFRRVKALFRLLQIIDRVRDSDLWACRHDLHETVAHMSHSFQKTRF